MLTPVDKLIIKQLRTLVLLANRANASSIVLKKIADTILELEAEGK